MKNPNVSHYLQTYPEAMKLWGEGKKQEAVANFVKSSCNLIVKGEKKAEFFAVERQAAVRSLKAPTRHEAETDALCKGLRAIWDNWPGDYWSGLENCDVYMNLRREINRRRDEWMSLYGIHAVAKRSRLNALRLKKFVRIMALVEKHG